MKRILFLFLITASALTAFASETDSIGVEAPDSLGMARSLGEVEVTARNQYAINGGTAYVPAKIAKRTSNDAFSLLQRTGISGIRVADDWKITNNIGEEAVTFIDGNEATTDEVRTLIPKDIERIEILRYSEDSRFRGLPFVVNFITRQFTYGGYVVAEGFQQFFDIWGSYNLFAKFVTGKSIFQFRGKMGFSRMRNWTGETTEHYDLVNYPDNNPIKIDRISEWRKRNGVSQSPGAVFSWRYQGGKSWALITRANFSYYNIPDVTTEGTIQSGDLTTTYSDYYSTHYCAPNIDIILDKTFSNGSNLISRFYFNTSFNKICSGYFQADDMEIHNRINENVYQPRFYFAYYFPFRNKNILSLYVDVTETIYSIKYAGTANTTSHINEGMYKASAYYQKIFDFGSDNNLTVTNSLSIPLRRLAKADGSDAVTCNPSELLNFNLSLGKAHSFRLLGKIEKIGRPASTINDIAIQDTDISGHRGNNNAKDASKYTLVFDYTWLPKNWVNLTGTVNYTHEMNALNMDFKAIDNVIYSQWVNSGVLSRLDFMADASFRLFKSSLIIAPGIWVNHTYSSGIFPVDFWHVRGEVRATYMMKNGLSFGANFETPASKWYENVTPALKRWSHYTFSFNASYAVGNLNASVDVRPLYKTVTMEEYTAISGIEINKISHVGGFARQITLTLRYTLDFGRKTAKSNEESIGSSHMTLQ